MTTADPNFPEEQFAGTHVSEKDLESAAWLIEQLSIDSGESTDRSKIRRCLVEAAHNAPSIVEDNWWEWLIEACLSLGLKCKVLDCTFKELCDISSNGGKLITRVPSDNTWLAIQSGNGRKHRVLQALREKNKLKLTSRKLRRLLQSADREKVIRTLVIEPQLSRPAAASHSQMTPLNRVWSLLQPEWSDIWIILVFALVTGLLALATPLAVETLVNTVAFARLLQPLIILALLLLAFLSFSAALQGLQTFVVEIIQRRLFARVTADLSYRLPRIEVSSIDGQHGPELVNRFFDIVTVQKVSAQFLLEGISLVLGTLIGMTVLAFYHPWLLGFDVILLVLIAFVIFVLGRGAVNTSIKESKSKYKIAAWLEDIISSTVAFRHRGAAEFALDHADRLTHEYLVARKKHFRVLMRQIIFSLGMQAIASTVLLGLGGWLVMVGQLTLGQLVAAELIVTVIVSSFAKLGKHIESYYDLLAAVDKLGHLFDLPIEPQDGLLDIQHDSPAKVTLTNACYSTPNGKNHLSNINLKIEPGEKVVITGPSGSGKSHLLDLLFGLRKPSSGHISINGLDPRDARPDMLRRYLALSRNIEIFSGSIEKNVHLERPHVSTNDVRAALENVGIIDEILALPEGLKTKLVSNGYPLTKTQAKKLMLARAIVGRPRLLLLDGILDGLPDKDIDKFLELLFDENQPWTLIAVSGRERVFKAASRIEEFGNA